MSSNLMLHAHNLGKDYFIYTNARQRLQHLLFGLSGKAQVFHALQGVSFDLAKGDSLGIIGQNGAGKSTLLQLICQTVTPTHGSLSVHGRIAPLLELGAGFNLDFTGRENIYMNAAILGLSEAQTNARLQSIIEFADIGQHLDQPVRFYSSGMYVRLAFAIASSIDPQILVIDEAISVGDGEFARKSFARIQELREKGATLLFCSHALYQVEALCEKALWLHEGQVKAMGPAAQVVTAYREWLDIKTRDIPEISASKAITIGPSSVTGHAQIRAITVTCDEQTGRTLAVKNEHSCVHIKVEFASDPNVPTPTVLVIIHGANGMDITSTSTLMDQLSLTRNALGEGCATLVYDPCYFLKGTCYVSVYLMCESGIHVYEAQERHTRLDVTQENLALGLVSLPHCWSDGPL